MQQVVRKWERIDVGPEWEAWAAVTDCGHDIEQRTPAGNRAFRLETTLDCGLCDQEAKSRETT